MKRNNKLFIGGGVLLLVILFFVFSGSSSETGPEVVVEVEQGEFVIDIMTSGSLDAKNSVPIKGPTGLRNYRIWNVTIQDIIDEGTEVKKGQYVARLDQSELTGKIKDSQLEVDETQSQFTQTRLDTALTMRQARDELINLEYTVREKQLTLDQSQFEPPATIQKAEIELEKAKRGLQQAKENYEIKRQQNVAKMQEASAELRGDKNELEGLMALSQGFTILAPQDGMLIYERSWDGKPVKAGSQVSAWDPVVATLPDLTKMISKTYVNEVDIRKVKRGQSVEIGFDAFPDKNLKGRVTKVANVGEQRPNSDAKVFEVEIEVFGTDPLLKPGMTTSNKIITKTVEDALFIPLECLHSQHDSITYVYKKSGASTVKQEVIIGDANAEHVHIIAGLDAGDRVHLSSVQGMENKEVILLEEMNGKRNPQKVEAEPEPIQNESQQPQRRRRNN
ncbi:Multidrug efflux pump subunit AcrA (membrane-fusion protein) [Ekhidna lutea]|uniref:Multidrug efflux pump subunit AcrA (Membrane-fusion protein) n=1 Tax=Ekhidna lutea TaxID=447679 RepID=A0A239HFN7_EKHLU|nr:efflux RND transporter periplasmic adaptor subunit [Ekhidna lutea]SNS80167.1 Multidrug efflux pump subunit AcrA (membrane-fusion protein) [Ekhidna lutea]